MLKEKNRKSNLGNIQNFVHTYIFTDIELYFNLSMKNIQ